eukprot:680514_1
MSVRGSTCEESVDGIATLTPGSAPSLSKNALKRLKRSEEWARTAPQRKLDAKERRKKRKAELKEKRRQNDRERVERGEITEDQLQRKIEVYKQENPMLLRRDQRKKVFEGIDRSKLRICIDLGFDEHMLDREIRGMSQQIRCAYGANMQSSEFPAKMFLTSFSGRIKEALYKDAGVKRWKLTTHEESLTDVFDKDEIVYLTAESETVLNEIDESKVYVIGGLLDHNRLKGLTHKVALERGFKTARLPICEYMTTRP